MRSRRRRLKRQRHRQQAMSVGMLPYYSREMGEEWDDFEDMEYDPDGPGSRCHYCHGEGWGIVGDDWDCHDGINGPYNGEIEKCPCCHGSGKAEDCTFW